MTVRSPPSPSRRWPGALAAAPRLSQPPPLRLVSQFPTTCVSLRRPGPGGVSPPGLSPRTQAPTLLSSSSFPHEAGHHSGCLHHPQDTNAAAAGPARGLCSDAPFVSPGARPALPRPCSSSCRPLPALVTLTWPDTPIPRPPSFGPGLAGCSLGAASAPFAQGTAPSQLFWSRRPPGAHPVSEGPATSTDPLPAGAAPSAPAPLRPRARDSCLPGASSQDTVRPPVSAGLRGEGRGRDGCLPWGRSRCSRCPAVSLQDPPQDPPGTHLWALSVPSSPARRVQGVPPHPASGGRYPYGALPSPRGVPPPQGRSPRPRRGGCCLLVRPRPRLRGRPAHALCGDGLQPARTLTRC